MKSPRTFIGGLVLLILALAPPIALADVPGTIDTIVGNYDPSGAPGITVPLDTAQSVMIASDGTVYFNDWTHVYRMNSAGSVFLVAGNGVQGYGGDGGTATNASLYVPIGVAFDGAGNLCFADTRNHRVRKINAVTGTITTIAGNGLRGYSGDGGPATNAKLDYPVHLAVDGMGNIYITDTWNHRVRKVDATTGIITTVAGTGAQGYNGDNIPATSARISAPQGVLVDGAGNLYFAELYGHRVRKVDAATGLITTIAGNGSYGYSGDGGAATAAKLYHPSDIAFDGAGNLYISDRHNHRIRKVDAATQIITTVAGNGSLGYSGDGGAATGARLNYPVGVAVDGAGNLYIADLNNSRVRKVDAGTQIITTVAGNGQPFAYPPGYGGDGGPASNALLNYPNSVAFDGAENTYILDRINFRVRKIDATTGIISTVAGNGLNGYSGDGGPATAARISAAIGIAVDGAGNLYIGDRYNNRVRKIDAATGIITTVAGNGQRGYSGDGIPATSARLNYPSGVEVDGSGNLYIGDMDNHRIRKVDAATGIITTVAGNGTRGYYGDGGPATAARLNYACCVAVNEVGDLYISDSFSSRIRKVDATTGIITTVAGIGQAGYSGDGGPATAARIHRVFGRVAIDGEGNLFLADVANNRIRKVDATTGIITTIAGNGSYGYSGDGGPGTAAMLAWPSEVELDSVGNLIIADTYNHRIRKVTYNQPPVAEAGPDQIVEATSPGGAMVTLDSAGTSDPDDDPVTCTWTGPFGSETGAVVTIPVALGTHTITLTADDGRGGTATDTATITVQDTTPPTITWTRTPEANVDGWNNDNVTVEFDCTDTVSEIETPPTTPQVVSDEGTDQSVTGTCTDDQGNESSVTVEGINIDKTPPEVTITSPLDGAAFELNQDAPAYYTCDDALSGLATCAGTVGDGANLPTASVGTFPFTVDATDLAGNVTSPTHTYSVNYRFIGFRPPVDNLPVLNVANDGRTVPVKWQLTDADGVYVSDLSTFAAFVASPLPSCEAAPTSVVEEEATSSTDPPLKYDPVENQFIYKWKTQKGMTDCWQIQLALSDGTMKFAKFKFK